MFCTNCGKPLAAGVKFCPECGTQQLAPVMAPSPIVNAPPVAAQPAVVAVPPPVVPPVATATAPAQSAIPVAVVAKSGPNKIALWGTIGALGLAAVGGAGYLGWSNKTAADEAAQKTASEDMQRKVSEETARRVAAEKAADAAEIKAAQASLDQAIAAAEARARSGK